MSKNPMRVIMLDIIKAQKIKTVIRIDEFIEMLYNFVEYLLKYTINAEIISSVFIDRCDLVRSDGV